MTTKTKFDVQLIGTAPILFDRYPGSNKEELSPENKLYLDGDKLVLPALNIMSFLSAENTESAPKRIIGKTWKTVAKAALSYVSVSPFLIPFTSKGKPVTAKLVTIVSHVARLPKGIPNPKQRPQLALPWELGFQVTLFENIDLGVDLLKRLFVQGGEQIGLGTFRGLYGKFHVGKWEIIQEK